jgi:hypothetical protein
MLAVLLAGAVGASSAQQSLVTVMSYQDLVRFQIQKAGVEAAQVQILDLSGSTIYRSDWSQGPTLDWPLITQQGRRVANGVFLYVLRTKNAQGQEQQWVGKLAVLDGVLQVGLPPELQLQPSDRVRSQHPDDPVSGPCPPYHHCGDFSVQGEIVAESAGNNAFRLTQGGVPQGQIFFASNFSYFAFHALQGNTLRFFTANAAGTLQDRLRIQSGDTPKILMGRSIGVGDTTLAVDTANKRLGIGTSSPAAALDIKGSATDLIRATNSATGQTVFKVQNDGDVFADRSYNCGLSSGCFNSSQGADVAERIDATEPLESGDVVEIDPENPGKFRKAREAVSRRVAGVISTAPAITLGNNFDPETDRWEDNRPLLALAGRVPVKAVAKFGAIEVGDLLVASPIPGYAMKCPEAAQCVGAIIGKALEPLTEGVGLIEAQVMLR